MHRYNGRASSRTTSSGNNRYEFAEAPNRIHQDIGVHDGWMGLPTPRGISFVFGPLRESTMGFRIFIGVVIGVSFRILQDMLGPLSIVFEFPPLMAVLSPVLFCVVVGLYLLKRSG